MEIIFNILQMYGNILVAVWLGLISFSVLILAWTRR